MFIKMTESAHTLAVMTLGEVSHPLWALNLFVYWSPVKFNGL